MGNLRSPKTQFRIPREGERGLQEIAQRFLPFHSLDLTLIPIFLDERASHEVAGGIAEIQDVTSRVKVLVVSTGEEREIAQQTLETIQRERGQGR